MATVKILDATFQLDLYDLDTTQAVEKAMETAGETMAQIEADQEKMSLSEYILATCRAVFTCMNAIFGDGADKKIFGSKCNLGDCTEAMLQLKLALTSEQEKALNQRIQKYLPNRQTRRAKK